MRKPSVLSALIIACSVAVISMFSFAPGFVDFYAPNTANAQHGQSGRYSNVFITHAYEEVSSVGTSTATITPGLLRTAYPKTNRALVVVSGQGIRFTTDGTTTPSTSVGIPVEVGSWLEIIGLPDIQNFTFVNDDGVGTPTCHVSLQYEVEMN